MGIFIAPTAKAPMVSLPDARAIPGRGLEGDRYFHDAGTFSKGFEPDSELTLIESEVIDALVREQAITLGVAEPRRNLATRDVRLNDLVGREFMIGAVRVLGHGLCEPCAHLERVTGEALLGPLLRRGGLRAQILSGGTLRVGDVIRPV